MRLLFVTWDGPETTYHQTLFMPLLARATRPEDEVHLLQFTWDAAERSRRNAMLAARLGMNFRVEDFGRQPSAIAVPGAIIRGGLLIARTVREEGIDVVLARSIIPGAMAIVARSIVKDSIELIYDADGLMADERAEFGGWKKHGLRYRLFTAMERVAIRRAQRVLVRTDQAAEILQHRSDVEPARFHVVTNAKDERVYVPGRPRERAATRSSLGVPADAPLLVYVGSIGPQYQPEQMVALFHDLAARRSDAHLLVLTPEQNHPVLTVLCERSLRDRLTLLDADPAEVPRYLASADVGIALRRPSLSQTAVSPIKVAEYLLCGLPVVYSPGVSDLDAVLADGPAYPVRGPDDDGFGQVSEWILEEVIPRRDQYRARAREKGIAVYSLDVGAEDYAGAFLR